eukprot:7386399-Prymnesium_polylepis.2
MWWPQPPRRGQRTAPAAAPPTRTQPMRPPEPPPPRIGRALFESNKPPHVSCNEWGRASACNEPPERGGAAGACVSLKRVTSGAPATSRTPCP